MLSANDKITAVLMSILASAQGAGMPQERAEAIYEDICAWWSKMDRGFEAELVDEIRKVIR